MILRIAAHRVLQLRHRLGGPHVVLAAHAHGVVAADAEHGAVDRRVGEGVAVAAHGLFRDLGQPYALDARVGAGEILVDEFLAQADRVEDLRAAIGLVGGDAHLGHHLQKPLVDRLDVALDDFLLVDFLRQVVLDRDQRLEGEIGVDRFRAVAGQTREMVHLARLTGLQHHADRGAQALADEVVVHGGAGEQRRDRNAVGAGFAVGEDEDVAAVAHFVFGALAQFVDRPAHAVGAVLGRIGHVEGQRLEMVAGHLRDRADLLKVLVGEDRLTHFQPLELGGAFHVEQVRPRPDDGDEAHHQLFADRIDRRVGDLREVLLEIGVERLGPVGHRRDRRVVAHGADRFLAGGRHRRHQELEVFLRVTEGLLAVEQRQVRHRRVVFGRRQFLELDLGAVQPLLVGMAACQRRLQFFVRDQPAFVEIDQQHLARLQPPLLDDVLFVDRQHAGFRRHHDAVVVGEQIARRPQAVAVERGADLAAVGEGDRRRAVPRLHQRGVVFVESAPLLVHERIARPGLGDHHHHGVGERIAALREEFERVVEAGGVGLALVGDRPQLGDVLAEQRRGDRRLPRRHPVDVAAQRVDLAVVRDVAVGMRQRPGREGVGGEALMHQRQRALEIRVVQVGIIGAELVGQEHALVDHRAARHRHRVIVGGAARAPAVDGVGDRLAHDVELALEGVLAELVACRGR